MSNDQRKEDLLNNINQALKDDESKQIDNYILKLKKCHRKLIILSKKKKKINKAIIKIDNNLQMDNLHTKDVLNIKKIELHNKIVKFRNKKDLYKNKCKKFHSALTNIQSNCHGIIETTMELKEHINYILELIEFNDNDSDTTTESKSSEESSMSSTISSSSSSIISTSSSDIRKAYSQSNYSNYKKLNNIKSGSDSSSTC